MRPHGKAEVDTSRPAAFAVCDRCGDWFNLETLTWQFEWAGTVLINLRRLVCWRCIDKPQDQLRTLILPPDPPPIINARTEPFSLDETSRLLLKSGGGHLLLAGGGFLDLANS